MTIRKKLISVTMIAITRSEDLNYFNFPEIYYLMLMEKCLNSFLKGSEYIPLDPKVSVTFTMRL